MRIGVIEVGRIRAHHAGMLSRPPEMTGLIIDLAGIQ